MTAKIAANTGQALNDLLGLLHLHPEFISPLLRIAGNMAATPFGDVTLKMQDGKAVLIETCKREKLT